MRLTPSQHRAYTYKVTVPPSVLAVGLVTFKEHIKKTNNAEDDLLTLYLTAAIQFAEQLMRRDLITRTYKTFRDFFPDPSQNEGYYTHGRIPTVSGSFSGHGNVGFEIRRSPLQSIESIKYRPADGGSEITIATTIFYKTIEEDYSEVLTQSGQIWPSDVIDQLQSITIEFKTGFGDADTDIPEDIKRAILGLATSLWKNRGDCDNSACATAIPAASKMILMQNRIENL